MLQNTSEYSLLCTILKSQMYLNEMFFNVSLINSLVLTQNNRKKIKFHILCNNKTIHKLALSIQHKFNNIKAFYLISQIFTPRKGVIIIHQLIH